MLVSQSAVVRAEPAKVPVLYPYSNVAEEDGIILMHDIAVSENNSIYDNSSRDNAEEVEDVPDIENENFNSNASNTFNANTSNTFSVANTAKTAETVLDKNKTCLGVFRITYYCPCFACCGKTDGITATGTKAKEGRTIAVDPKIIPYGTHVLINGHEYIAEDCGGSIKKNHIDIFVTSHKKAISLGTKKYKVYVLGN